MLFSKKLHKLPNFFCGIWRDLICFRGKDFMLEAINILKGVLPTPSSPVPHVILFIPIIQGITPQTPSILPSLIAHS